MIDNLNGNRDRDAVRRTGRTERQNSAERTAIGKGSFRILSNEGLYVLGSAVVSGWLIVTGTFKLVGTLLMEGTALFTGAFTARGQTRLEGDTTQKGPFHVEGKTDITGDIDIEGLLRLIGDALLTGDLVVGAGGEITVAGERSMMLGIGPSGLPALFFSTGGAVEGLPDGVRILGSGSAYMEANGENTQLASGGRYVRVTGSNVSIVGGNGRSITLNGTRTTIANGLALTLLPTLSKSQYAANLRADPDTGVISLLT